MIHSGPVVVTGVSSFVGARLAQHFAAAGHRVVGTLTRPAADYDPIRRARLNLAQSAGAELAALDLGNSAGLRSWILKHRPAIWIHHAGWAVDYGSRDYDLTRGFQINVAPLTELYAALKDSGCRGILITGSSAEYSDSDAPNREEDACLPTLPYGLSKLAETLRARQLALEHGLPTRVARLYIPFGPLDAPDKLVPSVVACLRAGRPIDLSPCLQARDFVHVEDVAGGYEALARDLERQELFDVFNLCSGRAVPLREWLLAIARLLNADPALLRFGKRALRPGEPAISCGANAKARRLLGWQPQALEERLRQYLQITSVDGTADTGVAQERKL